MESLNAFCLAAVVLLSLILPLYASATLRTWDGARKPLLAAIWAGQSCLGAAGLLIITGMAQPGLGLALAVLSCVAFGRAFRRQLGALPTDAAERAT